MSGPAGTAGDPSEPIAAGGRRIVCLWFPHWALDRWRRLNGRTERGTGGSEEPDRSEEAGERDEPAMPFVLFREGPRGPLIHDADEAALACGMAPGGSLTDAMSSVPTLRSAVADPHGDRTALDRAALWCARWSPHTRALGGAWGDGSVLLDLTGCAHLFGGERDAMADMRGRWEALGYALRIAAAPTPGAALALARFASHDDVSVEADGLERALGPLPVEALRLDAATPPVLKRLGLKTIGQLDAVPRKALARRFGKRFAKSDRDATWEDIFERDVGGVGAKGSALPIDPLRRLEQAFGRASEPLDPRAPDPAIEARKGLSEPIDRVEALAIIVDELIGGVVADLERGSAGARTFVLTAWRVDGGTARMEARASAPTRDRNHVARLFAERMDGLDAGFGFDMVALEARETEPLAERQSALERSGATGDGGAGELDGAERGIALSRLVDTLSGRLGERRVLVPVLHDSHWPERAEAWVPALGRLTELTLALEGADRPAPPAMPPRPERMFDPPEPVDVIYPLPEGPPARFRWRRMTYRVVRHAGPERIAPEWWCERGSARARDYYRVEDGEGQRFWMFREGLVDDERGAAPRWFMHGLFA